MDPSTVSRTVGIVSGLTALAAFLLLLGATAGFKTPLFSGQWFLVLFSGGLLTVLAYILALYQAVNWGNPDGMSRTWVDPGVLHKIQPLGAVLLGALVGGWRSSRGRNEDGP